MTSPTTTILFDLDGTLIDSVPDLTHAVNHALANYGKAPFTIDTVNHWIGNGAKPLVSRALNAAGLDAEKIIDEALPIYHAYYKANVCVDTYAFPGVESSLAQLKQAGFKLAIVTNKAERYVRPILSSLALLENFDCIVGGDTTDEFKPSAKPLLFAAERLGVQPKECIMVGDSKNDILAAAAANMSSIAVTYGYNYGEDINNYKPNYSATNFTEVVEILLP